MNHTLDDHNDRLGYPTAATGRRHGDTTWIEAGGSVVIVNTIGRCLRCDTPTHCIDFAVDAWLCPTCHEPAWTEFNQAMNHLT